MESPDQKNRSARRGGCRGILAAALAGLLAAAAPAQVPEGPPAGPDRQALGPMPGALQHGFGHASPERLRLARLEAAMPFGVRLLVSVKDGQRLMRDLVVAQRELPFWEAAAALHVMPDFLVAGANRETGGWTIVAESPNPNAMQMFFNQHPRFETRGFGGMVAQWVVRGRNTDWIVFMHPNQDLACASTNERDARFVFDRTNSGVAGPNLFESRYYRKAVLSRREESRAYWALEVGEIVQSFSRRSPDHASILARLGLGEASLVAGSLDVRDGILELDGALLEADFAGDPRPLLSPARGPHPLLDFVRSDALLVASARFADGDAAWGAWKDALLGGEYQGSEISMQRALQALDEAVGFSVENDLAPALGADAAFALAAWTEAGPEWLLALETRDAVLVDRLMRLAIERSGGAIAEFDERVGALRHATLPGIDLFWRFEGDVLLASNDARPLLEEPRADEDSLRARWMEQLGGPAFVGGDFEFLLRLGRWQARGGLDTPERMASALRRWPPTPGGEFAAGFAPNGGEPELLLLANAGLDRRGRENLAVIFGVR